jgi:REP element-mobilizing transposase RayT
MPRACPVESYANAMLIQPYDLKELQFAYCYRVYIRWRTHRGRLCQPLSRLDNPTLSTLVKNYDINVLECATNPTDLLAEVSLKPAETISSAASKLKGRVSSWLRTELGLQKPTSLLSLGYFACTVGKSTGTEVDKYLDNQGEHHGYEARKLPPIYVAKYELDETNLRPKHASVVSQFHIVLATSGRIGIFGSESGQRVAETWRRLQSQWRIALLKVSFVPDHVHLALRLHPAVSPADTVIELMNVSQELMKRELISAGVDRLWQPSAYVGSYGDLASAQIRKYIENWRVSE